MSLPVLMLLPGLNCDAAVWAPQVAALEQQARCVIPSWGLRDSLTAMAQQVLDEAPTECFALAGHSMGGRVALEVMRLAPQRVACLALLNTGTQAMATGEAGEQERAGRFALLKIAQEQGMRAMARQWARRMVHPDRIGTPLFDAVLDMLERGSAAQFEAQIKALIERPDATSLLPAVTCPTLVLTGREDGWSGPAQHEAMAAAIPVATLAVVGGCGHMSTMEQPNQLNAMLRGWLSNLTDRA